MIPPERLDREVLSAIYTISQNLEVSEALTGALLEKHFAQQDIGPLAVQWSVKRLDDLGFIKTRVVSEPFYEVAHLTLEGIRWLAEPVTNKARD
ncbi:hypothetical protein [Sphingomonas sp. Y38-1Y]|uniref:hypothetical protein n=1 Tax=Sphingomonas sp. Y38-1Y TaxID=3078265 RepID=UPI0028ED8D6C|nr:hypothetical protein [Sphingomonas sp. Y38-1Y]